MDPRRAFHRVPALDGLRGAAIALVLGYHFWIGDRRMLKGGWVGVDVFFALSGFLITSLLLRDLDDTGGISFRSFYRRRLRRLGPALATFVIAWWVISAPFSLSHTKLFDIAVSYTPRGYLVEAAGILTFSTNWLGIAGYGVAAGFGGLWSLAVEEQFYLVWPALLLLLLRVGGRRLAFAATSMLAGLSALLCFLLWAGNESQVRIYFATDTRAQGLLAGAVLAMLCRELEQRQRTLSRRERTLLGAVALAAVASVALIATRVSDVSPARCRGSFTIAAVATGAVILGVLLDPVSHVARALSLRPLRWLGARSYALYLWHVPIAVAVGHRGLVWATTGIALSLVLCELSWRCVESRFLHRRSDAGARVDRHDHTIASAVTIAASVASTGS